MEAIHRKVIDRIHTWIRKHPKLAIAVVGILAALLTILITAVIILQTPKQVSAPVATVVKDEPLPPPPVYYSPLSGLKVKNSAATKQAVTAIMIENSPDARPQSGISQAGVVYEAIAEGGITRFLTLFQQHKPSLVGPVRSVRLYFVDWLTPFNASVAHVGGSAHALRVVRNGSYRDIDQFFNAGSYWRSTDRYAPHNVYTSFKRLDALNKSKGYKTSKFTSWPRIDGKPAEKPNATKINVTVSSPLYNSSYAYNKKSNTYKRSMAGVKHVDREKGQLAPAVVITLDVNETTVFEDGYRQQITTSGSGRARIFQGGTVTTGKWVKKDRKSQIKFVDSEGKEIKLFRGQTWITAVPVNQGGKVSWR